MKNILIISGVFLGVVALYLSRKPVIKLITNMTRPQFIDTFSAVVRNAAKGTGLFPSLFMAQAILESSDSKGIPGNSGLAKNHNNFFGIKADKSWTGKKAIMKTREVINGKSVMVDAPFRAYATPEDSFYDRVKFLLKNTRYKNAGVFSAANPITQARALQKAGYATDPAYAEILTKIIDKYNLSILDQ